MRAIQPVFWIFIEEVFESSIGSFIHESFQANGQEQ